MSAIEYVDCTCALDFLREIEEINPRFREGRWIYRGHANANWNLRPKAFRDDNTFFDEFVEKYISKYDDIAQLEGYEREELARHGVTENNYGKFVELVIRLEAEKKAVAAFCNLADRVGLVVPIDEGSFWSENPDVDSSIRSNLGRFSLRATQGQIRFALARHHGIPTRLLDWTFKPYVAAYFASLLAGDSATHIAVWALDTAILGPTERLRLIQHRRTRVGFLSAQDGVFVIDSSASERYFEHERWFSLEEIVDKEFDERSMCKITLPIPEVEELARLLWKKDVSLPFLMPSFDNVVQELLCNRVNWLDLIEG